MKENNIKAEDTTWEEVEERAALVAEADGIAGGNTGKENMHIGTESVKEKKIYIMLNYIRR